MTAISESAREALGDLYAAEPDIPDCDRVADRLIRRGHPVVVSARVAFAPDASFTVIALPYRWRILKRRNQV